ncbi:hypothetical protein NQZ68_000846 [Dissostichus eleginoides]|nr:hypothetical protein NQZ68_000846 [Dissostichus eleginoides]
MVDCLQMPLDTDEDHSYNKRPYSFLPKESFSVNGAIITGQVKSPWAKKFEDDDQVDRVLSFLSQVVEKTQTERRFTDEVAFVMDVLLPEATVHVLTAVLSVSLERAKETYKCGPEYDWSEMELCAHDLAKNMSEEAQQRLKDFSGRFRRALDSEEFLNRL